MGAREIVYPIIAMTITLAAVFAPIGFVSGLTGALFREFAFTLAGAVIVSGVIALTLSPMMCSRLLKAHNGGGGGRFTALPRPHVRWAEAALSAAAARHSQLPPGDLARARWRDRRDRPHVHDDAEGARAGGGPGHPVHPGQDAAIRQSRLSRGRDPAALQGLLSTVPEKDHVFTINGMGDVHQGFAGILLKPWGERTRNQKEVLQELEPRISSIATAQALAFSPPALPGSVGGPPVQFVITTTRDFRELADVLADVEKSARESGLFIFSDFRPSLRDAADRVSDRSRQGQPARHLHGRYRRLAGDAARRQLRQSVRSLRAQLSGDPAGAARLSPERRLAHALPDPHGVGHARAAVERRLDHQDGAAERAHQFPAAQFGDALGRAVPGPHGRRGHRVPEGQGEELPRRLLLRFPGREPAVRAGGQHARLHLHLRADRHLPGARRAI